MPITIRSTKTQSREGSVGKYQHCSCAGTHTSAKVLPIELKLPLQKDDLHHTGSDFEQLVWIGCFLLIPEHLYTHLCVSCLIAPRIKLIYVDGQT